MGVTGWSENMTRTVQQLSHAIRDDYHGIMHFGESLPFMDGARVCVNQDGVAAWYTNGSTVIEGYHGKDAA